MIKILHAPVCLGTSHNIGSIEYTWTVARHEDGTANAVCQTCEGESPRIPQADFDEELAKISDGCVTQTKL